MWFAGRWDLLRLKGEFLPRQRPDVYLLTQRVGGGIGAKHPGLPFAYPFEASLSSKPNTGTQGAVGQRAESYLSET